ncbi:MAG: hypothetical protein QW086_06475 [Pyrobaculum sp.]
MDVVERINPWWFDPRWEERDRHIRQWEGEKVKVGAPVDLGAFS